MSAAPTGPTDPGILQFLAESAAAYPDDAVSHSMADQRGFYDALCRHFRKARPAGIVVEDRSVGSVPIRHYAPPQATSDTPCLLYLHGGGFVVGGLDSHDDICAEIAARANVHVVAVAYRLAPEHRYPAAFDDSLAVYRWLAGGAVSNGRLVVGGDSAGGNLAAAIAIAARDAGLPRPAGQVLIYPGLGGDRTKGSYVERGQAPGLTTSDVAWYEETYLGPVPAHRDDKFAKPLRERDYRNLPPAFLVTCEWDPLRDDAYDYASALAGAGVAAQVRHEPQLVHAFLRARHMSDPAARSFTAIVEAVSHLAHEGRLPRAA
ncbi:MAG: alpha/beta hydrolase [Hyphomicrobiales bacterium]